MTKDDMNLSAEQVLVKIFLSAKEKSVGNRNQYNEAFDELQRAFVCGDDALDEDEFGDYRIKLYDEARTAAILWFQDMRVYDDAELFALVQGTGDVTRPQTVIAALYQNFIMSKHQKRTGELEECNKLIRFIPSKQLSPLDVYHIVIEEIESMLERECTFNERYDIFWVTKVIVGEKNESEHDICSKIIPLLSMSVDYSADPSVPLVLVLKDVMNCSMKRLGLIKAVESTEVDNNLDQHSDTSDEISVWSDSELKPNEPCVKRVNSDPPGMQRFLQTKWRFFLRTLIKCNVE